MTLDPRTWLRPELLQLLDRWIALREEELLLLRSLRAALPPSEEWRRSDPIATAPVEAAQRVTDEEMLLALLRSFEGAPPLATEAPPPEALEPGVGESPIEFAKPMVADSLVEFALPTDPGTPPFQSVPERRALGEFVLLVDQGDGWVAFPWEAVTRVSTSDDAGEHPFQICFSVLGEERDLRVARTGRIVSRAAAAELGVHHEWRVPEAAGEEPNRIPLRGVEESEASAPTPPVEAAAEPVEPESPAEPAPPGEPEPTSELDEVPPLAPLLRPVLVYEVDASEPHTNGVTYRGEAEVPTLPTGLPETRDLDAGTALVAVRYLPARVTLARALRLAGWNVVEDADVNESIVRRTDPRPGLVCVELPEAGAETSRLVRVLAREGTRVFLVASRHRVVAPLELDDLPRLLHPFTEGELDRLPAPPAATIE